MEQIRRDGALLVIWEKSVAPARGRYPPVTPPRRLQPPKPNPFLLPKNNHRTRLALVKMPSDEPNHIERRTTISGTVPARPRHKRYILGEEIRTHRPFTQVPRGKRRMRARSHSSLRNPFGGHIRGHKIDVKHTKESP